jgi:succinoglycan biosynthesis protein ExoA
LAERPLPGVSVIMPVLNAETTIADAVASALGQDYRGDLEIVIGHGPSRDGTADILEQYAGNPQVRVVDNPSGRTPSGLNAAIEASHGEVIVRCDAQSRLSADYVRRAVEILQDTGADNVGGIQAAEGVFFMQRSIAIAQSTPLGVGDARHRTGGKPGPADTVYLGVFRRQALERVGGFDETQIRNQDYELNCRLRETGGTVYFHPDLRVVYRPRSSLRGLWRQYWGYGVWKRAMLRKHPHSLRWRQLAPPALVLALAASLAFLATPWPWAAAVVPGLYLLALVATAIAEGLRRRDAAALALPVVLPTMHLAWGLGFLFGRGPEPAA